MAKEWSTMKVWRMDICARWLRNQCVHQCVFHDDEFLFRWGRTSECTLRSIKDIYTEFDESHQILIQLMLYAIASEWPRGLRCGSATARLPEFRVRIPSGTWMFVCCECCVLSGRGLCDGLIPCPEEFYECLSVVIVVCCHVEVPATGWSLFQRSSMDICLFWVLCFFR